ncbi:MAG TPA: glycosyltransferase [Urbifossiella sp.]|nr:glycosyltransferase [Urbifossiella sp.]
MLARTPTLSLIVPTRGRPRQLHRFLRSLAATTLRPSRIEIVLVVDADDHESQVVRWPGVRVMVGPPGRTMGELNRAGAAAARGEWLMLLNDDVVSRTRGWDEQILTAAARFPDRIGLVHVNDTLVRDHLCVFPVVSRRYCEAAGGICPPDYRRYRIDDHIDDVFTRLGGRAVYLPDVVFEHRNAVVHPTAGKVYEADPAILAEDAPRFDAHHARRVELVRRLGGEPTSADAFSLRVPGRQDVVRGNWAARTRTDVGEWLTRLRCRLRDRYQRAGAAGLVRVVGRKLGLLG